MDEDSSTEQKTQQVYSLGKRNVFRLHLNESSEGFCRAGRGLFVSWCLEPSLERKGKVIPCRWSETGKGVGANSGESGMRNLEAEYQKQSGEYGRVCKVEDGHSCVCGACHKLTDIPFTRQAAPN